MLLEHHYGIDEPSLKLIIEPFTKGYYSHHHMINRHEARNILGADHVEFADGDLASALDDLLRVPLGAASTLAGFRGFS